MVSPIFTSAMAGARRRMSRHQHVPASTRLPMWRLLAGEVVYLARSAGRKVEIAAAAIAAVLVAVGLSPATPGPVAAPALRILVGAAAAAAAWAAVWVFSRPGPAGTDAEPVWRQVASGFAMVLLAVAGLALLAWLLAVGISLAFLTHRSATSERTAERRCAARRRALLIRPWAVSYPDRITGAIGVDDGSFADLGDSERLRAVERSGLLDAAGDVSIDRVTRLVSHLLAVPVSLVSVVVPERQFFASRTGLSEPWATERETPLSHSFCQYVVVDDQPLVIEDAHADHRVRDNAAIEALGVVAYLGVPLRDPDGIPLGSLCAIDHQPRRWSDRDLQTLQDLAATLTTELQLRRLTEQLEGEAETERATGRRAAQTNARRLRALADNAADVIYELRFDPEPRMAYINPAVEELTGIPAETFLDDPERMAAIVHPEDLDRIRQAQRRDPGGAVEFRVRGRDGSWTWASARTHLIHDERGALVAVQGIIRDIEATKRREAALTATLEAQRHATDELQRVHDMRSAFLTAISHELRTPLTSVLGFADVLHRAGDTLPQDRRAELLDRLRANAHRLGDLLGDILDVQRLQANAEARMETTETRLDVLADTFVRSLGPDSHRIELDLAPVTIRCHRERVKRVMGNLLDNAIRHTREGTAVRLAVGPAEGGAELIVEDRGSGISDERKPTVFDAFTQGPETAASPNPGTGIGLALVAEFVRAHGGSVEVGDAPGGGARFTVVLPATPSSP